MEVVENYAELVRNARGAMKQEVLAKKINEPESLVSRIETGKVTPSEDVARKLEKTLHITLLQGLQNTIVEVPKSDDNKEITLGDIVKIKKRK